MDKRRGEERRYEMIGQERGNRLREKRREWRTMCVEEADTLTRKLMRT